MRTINKVTLLGNVGADPSVNATQGGSLVANFSLATSYKTKEKNGGASREFVEWHRLTAWGRTAEIVRDYIRKGAALYVEGQLQTRKYYKDGVTHYSTEIIVRELSMVGSKAGATGAASGAGAGASGGGAGAGDGSEIDDDDIPF